MNRTNRGDWWHFRIIHRIERGATGSGRPYATDPGIITPLRDEHLSLEQRLARFDPECHGGEAMSVDERLGAERW